MHLYLLSLLLGFLIGSLPTTYLLVKWRKKLDIRKTGSGNVGTMNVLEVTGSPVLGVGVLVIDILKGVVAVVLAGLIFGPAYWFMGAAGVGAVLGHNYSPWLSFRGGRGLATSFGISLALGWVVAVVWIVLFALVYTLKHDLHVGNIAASLLLPPVVALLPDRLLTTLLPGKAPGDIFGLAVCICCLLLLGHLKVITEFFKSSRNPSS